ncbi:TPA: hypothetical protein ACT9H1_001936 [Legionella pneumophila]|uniref:hypothetical protein n=1 Tax=Legionella pneumophila TaxID=446 RepID=UPI0018AC3B0C|nr:hypothetical protein [Legionella pneumophila]HBC2507422.1 hypothetical protein [Legionella pneumophila]HCE5307032.1 hypothetical protein [Legionella pneumophila]HCE5435409.1 hypothetical protein [Legionella pneumophila]HCE5654585.1 hypothetical protein [Legionella pneumophila]HCF9880149.1 hypothetical protein [Legionella pneumophila]
MLCNMWLYMLAAKLNRTLESHCSHYFDMSPFEDRESKLNPLPANFPKRDNLEEEDG